MIRLIFTLAAALFVNGAALASSYCYNNVCGAIQCAGGCVQQSVNGVCTANYCTGRVAEAAEAPEAVTLLSGDEKCAPNAVSGSNSVSGCGNTVSGVGNVVSGHNNVVSGVNNQVYGSCLVVSGVGGYYTGNNCR